MIRNATVKNHLECTAIKRSNIKEQAKMVMGTVLTESDMKHKWWDEEEEVDRRWEDETYK